MAALLTAVRAVPHTSFNKRLFDARLDLSYDDGAGGSATRLHPAVRQETAKAAEKFRAGDERPYAAKAAYQYNDPNDKFTNGLYQDPKFWRLKRQHSNEG